MNSTKHAMINTSICGSEGIQMLLVETKNSLSAQFYCTITKTATTAYYWSELSLSVDSFITQFPKQTIAFNS